MRPGSDGRPLLLVDKRCPYCDALWERREPVDDRALSEIRCRQCKRLVRYIIVAGQVVEPARVFVPH